MNFDNIEAFEGVIIQRDKLLERRWVPDTNSNKGYYDEFDITNNLCSYLPFACVIDEGTTLRDLFKILDKHKEILSQIFSKYNFNEYLEYSISCPILTKEERCKSQFFGDVDYLEIYTFIEHTNSEYVEENIYLEMNYKDSEEKWKTLVYEKGTNVKESTWSMLGFRGLSYPMDKDLMEKHGYRDEKHLGKRTKFMFFGDDIKWLMDCEIKIAHILHLHDSFPITHKWVDTDWKNYYNFSLFNIIACVFHQISFHGDIEKSNKIREELFSSISN